MNRKELTVFVQTTDEDTELSISSTRSNVVVIALPNGMKVGVDPSSLIDALYDLKFFKQIPTYEVTDVSSTSSILTIGESK
jgi:hypothetical protein